MLPPRLLQEVVSPDSISRAAPWSCSSCWSYSRRGEQAHGQAEGTFRTAETDTWPGRSLKDALTAPSRHTRIHPGVPHAPLHLEKRLRKSWPPLPVPTTTTPLQLQKELQKTATLPQEGEKPSRAATACHAAASLLAQWPRGAIGLINTPGLSAPAPRGWVHYKYPHHTPGSQYRAGHLPGLIREISVTRHFSAPRTPTARSGSRTPTAPARLPSIKGSLHQLSLRSASCSGLPLTRSPDVKGLFGTS